VRATPIVLGGLVLAVACSRAVGAYHASPTERATLRAEMEAMLARAAVNWNRGDLDAFVDDYLPSDTTTYVGRRLLRGRSAIRASYAPLFAPDAVRDSLSFEVLDLDPLAPDVVNLIGRYTLKRRMAGRDSVTASGPTSLVMRRVQGRWRIVHDHSS
jgi:beta-aspartyl-peptidase (threonine type)